MDTTEEDKARIREKVDKLKNSRFKQQTLPAWRPIPSFRSTMITFTVFGVIFLGLGVLLYIMSDKIYEKVVPYDNLAQCRNTPVPNECKASFTIETDVAGPIYVYYQLDNFYQNHRRYVKSRSFNQLNGQYLAADASGLKECDPIMFNKDLPSNTMSFNNKRNLSAFPDEPAIPCGLVAKSFFKDTYVLNQMSPVIKPVEINKTGIAWQSDVEYKFKNTITNIPAGKEW